MTLTRLFKGIIIASLLLIAANLAFAGELIVDFEEDSVPVLNEELRKLKSDIDGVSSTRILMWYYSGAVATGTNVSARILVRFDATIINATAYVKTAPTGADMIIDINLNGTTLWASDKLTISDGDNDGETSSFDITEITTDDVFTLDIDQIGSGTAGANLTVQLEVTT